jgi:tetratricopeptide (TPR) repeat protein
MVFVALGTAAPLHAFGLLKSPSTVTGPQSSGASERIAFIRDCLLGNRIAEALEAADRFAREQPDDSEALLQLAELLASRSQHARAAALFARVNELRPRSPNVLYNLGVAYYHLEQLDQAAQALAQSADLDEKPAETHYSLALIATERNDSENAILEIQHAVERAPQHAEYYALLGQGFSKVRYWQGAAAAYRRAAAIEPSQAIHFLHLGDALIRTKDLKGAIDAFKTAERLNPLLPEINYLIAFAYQNDGQFEQARQYYQRQLAMVRGHLASLLGAGTVAVEQSRFADAEKFLQLALASDPDHVQANYELGFLWFKKQQYDQAIEVFNRVLGLRPDHTQAEYYLYLALSRSHQGAAAETALAKWKKLEALDRKVRSQEVAYEMARAAHWENQAASTH